jgi:hypothetical protein
MKKRFYLILVIVVIITIAFFIFETNITSINDIKQNPESYKDRLVIIQGHGITETQMMLCSGYIGMDTRTIFIDSHKDSIVSNAYADFGYIGYDENMLKLFLGYIRIFNGQIGCPGDIRNEAFPFFEIIRVF